MYFKLMIKIDKGYKFIYLDNTVEFWVENLIKPISDQSDKCETLKVSKCRLETDLAGIVMGNMWDSKVSYRRRLSSLIDAVDTYLHLLQPEVAEERLEFPKELKKALEDLINGVEYIEPKEKKMKEDVEW